MSRLLITGASGLLGSNLAYTLSSHFDTFATYYQHPFQVSNYQSIPMNIVELNKVQKTIHQLKPNVVIHCAAETRVDYCETHPDEAFRINVIGTENLVKISAGIGSRFLYISTDSVFDGRAGMYNEAAKPNPLNVYAQSKLKGEQVVQRHIENSLIIRTNIYGWNARPKFSLAEWVLNRLDNDQIVPGFSDIYFSPILVNDLADILADMIAAGLQGLYHVGASDYCSKFDFAKMIGRIFNRDLALIQATNSDETAFKAQRPKNTSLDVAKISRDLGKAMPVVIDGLRRFKNLFDNGYVDRLRSTFNQ